MRWADVFSVNMLDTRKPLTANYGRRNPLNIK
jgi:hypothetical protein